MRMRFTLLALGALAATSCSSVELPAERTFGLTVPPVSESAVEPAVEVLRVSDLQLAGAIDRDYPMIAAGVEVGWRELDRWVAPVDRLVTDAFVLGLARSGVASLVKTAADPGVESWSLHGRILEFAEIVGDGGNSACVALELWLEVDDRLQFRDEFRASEPIGAGGTAAAAEGLSRGLATIVAQVAARLRRVTPIVDLPPATVGR